MNKQLRTLLDDSLSHYRKRQLKKALNAAQIALEFGINEGASPADLARANLTLAKIFITNGKYRNEEPSLEKAKLFLAEADRLQVLAQDRTLYLEVLLGQANFLLNSFDFEAAEKLLLECLDKASQQGHLDCTVLAFAELSRLFFTKNEIDKGVAFAEEGYDFLKKNVQSNHIGLWLEIYLQLSQGYIRKQAYSNSLEMSQELLALSRRADDVEKEVIALRNIAVVCGVKSNYKIGMQYFLEALDKCELIGFRELIVQIQINIGTLYAHLYNYDEAISRYSSVLEEYGDVLEDKTKVVVYNNLGNIFYTTDEPKKALTYFDKANVLAIKCGYLEMVAHSFAQMSRSKISLDRLAEAAQDAEAAQALFLASNDLNGKQINLLNLANLAYHNGHLEQAVALAEEAIETSKRLKDDTSEIRCYRLLSLIFKALGDFEKALAFQEQYMEIQEAFAKVQRNRQFLDMEIRHAIREKQKEIEQLVKDNDYQALLLQKSDQIARQNIELLQVNEDLRQFAYVASHDLKEPLRMIGSYTHIIQRMVNPNLDHNGRQYFGFVTDGVTRMNNLLDGLLKYATVGNSELELETVNMRDVMDICVMNLKVRVEEAQAIIECNDLPLVRGSQNLLNQLFQNLIGNALKFVRPGVQPFVKIFAKETTEEHIIVVQDNGIGISPEHKERIFEIFQRLNGRTEYEGTGIGLAICQKITKRLNGRIWVESEEGKGAAFFFALAK